MKKYLPQFTAATWCACCAILVALFIPYYETWEHGHLLTKKGFEHPFAWLNFIVAALLIYARFSSKKEAFDIVLICLVLYIIALLGMNMVNSLSLGRPSGDHMSWGFLIMFISTAILIIQGFKHSHEKPVK